MGFFREDVMLFIYCIVHVGNIFAGEYSKSDLFSIFPHAKVSESGVHRPHVAGIHGREHEGAYSIVLSGGYEDDVVSTCR